MQKFIWTVAIVVVVLTGGCSSMRPAVFEDGIVSNPTMGWNGYSFKAPEGMEMIYPGDESGKSSKALEKWYKEELDPLGYDLYSTFSEAFVFQPEDEAFSLVFTCRSYSLDAGWSTLPNVRRQWFIRKLISWRKVEINDTEAEARAIEVKGHHGWYISGQARPDFKKNVEPVAYEGFFLLGSLKEVYWVEAFGDVDSRERMKQAVQDLLGSLTY